MLLQKIRIQNFRQYDDVTIPFERGLTAIVGPNGAGKSTLVEAIVFALYGENRSRKDTLKPLRPEAGEPSVTLWFQLGDDHFRVSRSQKTATLYLVNDAEELLAQSLSRVTAEVERRLGLTYEQFINSFCTQQKNADFLRFSTQTRRIEELTRMLGYDDLRKAARLAHRACEQAKAEYNALTDVAQGYQDVEQRVALARVRLEEQQQTLTQLEERAQRLLKELEEIQPQVDRAKEVEQWCSEIERVQPSIDVTRRHVEERRKELADAESRLQRRESLREQAQECERLSQRLGELEALRATAAEIALGRRRLEQLNEEIAELSEELSQAGDTEWQVLQASLEKDKESLANLRATLQEKTENWRRQGEAKRQQVLQLESDAVRLRRRLQELEGAAKDGVCITCGQALPGGRLPEQDVVESQLAESEEELVRCREEARMFDSTPEQLLQLEAEARELEASVSAQEAQLAVALDRAQRRERLQEQLADKECEAERLRQECANDVPFDEAEYEAVRAELSSLESVYREYLALATAEKDFADASERLAREEQQLKALSEQIELYQSRIEESGFSLDEAREILQQYEQKRFEAHTLVQDIEAQRKILQGFEREMAEAEEAMKRYNELRDKIAERARAEVLNRTVKRAMESLSSRMTEEIRPELERYASDYVAELSRGRYRQIKLSADFEPTLMDDIKGTACPKAVISGGEEDLVHLSLRLALSHFIRSNANQSLSLLILDEVFGSLDDERRGAVLDQLRAISDIFEQVLIISHVDAINDAADRVIEVYCDPETRISRVTGTDIWAEEFALSAG